MKIVCCCVTSDRPGFMPWLRWNFEKQTHKDKELLVVDSFAGISAKRNECLDRADGDAIAWMDDDDWQAPNRLELLAGELMPGVDMVGTHYGAWINLQKRIMIEHRSPMMIFNSCLVRMDAAKLVRFDESKSIAEDTKWMRELLAKSKTVTIPDRLHAWICHESNTCNPASSICWDKAESVHDILGSETTEALQSIHQEVGQ